MAPTTLHPPVRTGMQFTLETTDLRSSLEFVLHWPEPFMVLKFCSMDNSQSGALWIKDATHIIGAATKPPDCTGYRAMLEIAKVTAARFEIVQVNSEVYGEPMMLKIEDMIHNLPRVLTQIETRLAYIEEHASQWATQQRANQSSAQIDDITARRKADVNAAGFDHLLVDMNEMLRPSPQYPLLDQRDGLDDRRRADLERAAGRLYDYDADQAAHNVAPPPPTVERPTDHMSSETVERILNQHASGHRHRLSRMPDKDKAAAKRRIKDTVCEVEEASSTPGWLSFFQRLFSRWLQK